MRNLIGLFLLSIQVIPAGATTILVKSETVAFADAERIGVTLRVVDTIPRGNSFGGTPGNYIEVTLGRAVPCVISQARLSGPHFQAPLPFKDGAFEIFVSHVIAPETRLVIDCKTRAPGGIGSFDVLLSP